MKKNSVAVLILIGAFAFMSLMGGCSGKNQSDGEKMNIVVGGETSDKQAGGTAKLLAVYFFSSESEIQEEHSYAYEGELTVEKLAAGLTEWTGMDFFISATVKGETVTIDWATDSSLFTCNQVNEDFLFFDIDSVVWFMLDSLWRTTIENMGVKDVIFTMDGGLDLALERTSPSYVLPQDEPYMGSAYYTGNAGASGGED